MTLEESAISVDTNNLSADDNAVDIPINGDKKGAEGMLFYENTLEHILIQLTEKYFNFLCFLSADEDDDVIVVPITEVITEIPSDDEMADDKSKPSGSPAPKKPALEEEICGGVYTNVANESDIQILEPAISVMDLDQIEDEPENPNNTDEASQLSLPIKIKEEPKYEGYEDGEEDAFEVVGTFEESGVNQTDEASGKFFLFYTF